MNVTGSAHDGQLANSYSTNELAQWDQQGYVHRIEVKDPFTNEWQNSGMAIDESGADNGIVTRFNHPFSAWYFEIDMSNREEGDYSFEFRSYDGTDYSEIITRTFKINTEAPIVLVSTPASLSSHSDGIIHFEGDSSDPYGCPLECNIDYNFDIHVDRRPKLSSHNSNRGNMMGVLGTGIGILAGNQEFLHPLHFTVWASDSDFCNGIIDVCSPIYSVIDCR